MKNLDPTLFDHETTLTNFSCSLLKHFGVDVTHPTIKEVDEALLGHKKVACFLFDGAGKYNLGLYPHTTKYIREHELRIIHSVNPATTVACTTSFLSGKFPIEHGWMGWSLQFDEVGGPVDVFTNKYSLTGEKLAEDDFMDHRFHYQDIASLMSEKGVKAKLLFHYPVNGGTGPKNTHEFLKRGTTFFRNGGEFLYGYFPEPDHSEHKYGVHNFHVRNRLAEEVRFLKRFVKKNPDVLVFSFADHGLVDVQYRNIAAYKDIENCLAKPLSLEGRTASFFIKEGMGPLFEAVFNKHLGKNFTLLSKKEVLDSHYFGVGQENAKAYDFIGDYLAIAIGKDLLSDPTGHVEKVVHIGHHAGATLEEREILLGIYNR